ncbi:uncharacterized protein [Clytia hemisphaerica]|uniref:Uncharacterized protein n=1 Tax=Clytia hemisphaerica TaxID=252671 RepID=A0A7M5X047_9CNID
MALHCKQTFLPSSIQKLVDKDEILDTCQDTFHYGSNNGFDSSGCYFSIYFQRGLGLSRDYDGCKVMLYRFENDEEKIGTCFINLYRSPKVVQPPNFNPFDPPEDAEESDYVTQKLEYDVVTMRWFNVEKTSKDDGDHQLTVYSSCLRPLYENGGKKTIDVEEADDGNDVLVLSYPNIQGFLGADINNMVCGNFLVLMVTPDEANFIVDLIKFDDKEIFHFKRLTARGDYTVYNPLSFGLPSKVYLDMEWQRFYVMSNYELYCYDFNGEKIFDGSIRNYEVDKMVIEKTMQVSNRVFITAISPPQFPMDTIRLIEITRNEIKLGDCIKLSSSKYNFMHKYIWVQRYLGKQYFCWLEARPNTNCFFSVNAYDLQTGGEAVLYKFEEPFYGDCYLNWNMRELALVTELDDEERIKRLCVERIPFFMNSESNCCSLKEQARFVCLNNFHEGYLCQKLPKDLLRFLDIL